MISNDKRIINKLKRRLGVSLIIVFVLIYWIIQKNSDLEYYRSDNEMFFYDMLEKDKEIEKLKFQLDSIKSNKDETVVKKESKILINSKKINKKDTLIVVEQPKKVLNNQSDTLNR